MTVLGSVTRLPTLLPRSVMRLYMLAGFALSIRHNPT